MSSTNRGAIRNEADFYPTPETAIFPIIDRLRNELSDECHDGYSWLEPAVGDSAIIKAVEKYNQIRKTNLGSIWDVVDIRADIRSLPACVQDQYRADFLEWKPKNGRKYSVIILAERFQANQP